MKPIRIIEQYLGGKMKVIHQMLPEGYNIIKEFEGFRNYSYQCSAGVWTIGWGSTMYTDGLPVIEGEYIEENLISMNLLLIGIGKELIPIETDLRRLCTRSTQGRYIPVRDTHNAKKAIQHAFREVSDLLAQINVEDFIENN